MKERYKLRKIIGKERKKRKQWETDKERNKKKKRNRYKESKEGRKCQIYYRTR